MTNIQLVLSSLRRIIRSADIHSKHLTKTAGLTAPQLMLMQAIGSSNEGMTLGNLAKEISLSQATVTNIIDRLESRGVVERVRSSTDKRFVRVHLTEQGAAALSSAPTPMQEHFVNRFSALDDWEQSMILASLQRLAKMMDAEQIDAAPFLEVGAIDVSTAAQPKPHKYKGQQA